MYAIKIPLKMGNYTIFWMFENPRRGRQARNFTTNVPKILDLKSSFEQIFSKNWRWVPLIRSRMKRRLILPKTGFTRLRSFTSFFIDVDTFYLFLNWFGKRVSGDQKYVCGRRLYATQDKTTSSFAYNESVQHPAVAVLLIKILLFFFDHSVVFTFSKVINAFKR